MLLDSNNQQTETNCAIVGQGFSIKASPLVFTILLMAIGIIV